MELYPTIKSFPLLHAQEYGHHSNSVLVQVSEMFLLRNVVIFLFPTLHLYWWIANFYYRVLPYILLFILVFLFILIYLFFLFHSYFAAVSGVSIYESWVYTGFNFILGLPIIFYGIQDRDISAAFAVAYPEVCCCGIYFFQYWFNFFLCR